LRPFLLILLLCSNVAAQELVEGRTATWPFTLDVHVLVGVEPHDRGAPVAFGIGAEALYHGWVGPFASLLSSEGSPITPPAGKASLADRISVPLGLALRPAGRAAARHDGWGWRLLGGLGFQVGLTVEHLRSNDTDKTTAGLHLGAELDVPLWGGPLSGGIALRLAGRLMVTPAISLEANQAIREPITSGQLFAGLCYTP
jgi:hypothetical protein